MTLHLKPAPGPTATAKFPKALQGLFQPCRYKVLYGGRGGGKSWGVATYLLAIAAKRPTRILCCREFQSSIRESVHKLLGDMIVQYRFHDRYDVLEKTIRGKNGSEIIFEGLHHNVGRIRSLEGIDKVWVEEAQNVSKSSWEVLIPTIRKDGSEIILTFNPNLETDETYQRFVVHPPSDSTLMKVSYLDNPWFPKVLRQEAEELRDRDPDAFQHIYLGECRYALEGAIYAKEIREAQEQGRITDVRYDPTKPVNVYFDLGWADNTSVWFAQHVAGECRFIDFIEDSQRPFNDYLKELQNRNYVYGTVWLPHDAEAKSLGTGRSVQEIALSAGWRVRIVPRLSVADGINAVRTLFPSFWFDRNKTADGLQSLRYYRYDVDADGQRSRNPCHDNASHAADALRYVAVAMQGARQTPGYQMRARAPRPLFAPREPMGIGWMRQ